MGSSTYSDTVKACASIWKDGNTISSCKRNPPPKILIPYYNAKFGTEYETCPDVVLPVVINGWTSPASTGHTWKQIGKKNRLCGDIWSNGDKRVYEVNEDPDAAGGGVFITICADSLEELQEFLKDLGLSDCEIYLNEVVEQTL